MEIEEKRHRRMDETSSVTAGSERTSEAFRAVQMVSDSRC